MPPAANSSLRIALMVVGLLAGGWMLVDGVHVLVYGKYIGPDKPGPWSGLFTAMGVDPFRLGPLFVGLGAAWLICLVATLRAMRWGWYGAAAVAVASVWYLPVGTLLSMIYLMLLLSQRLPPSAACASIDRRQSS
jgi:hypothetical protein